MLVKQAIYADLMLAKQAVNFSHCFLAALSRTLMSLSMSASTLAMVILCITMSRTRRSRVCHFCRAEREKDEPGL